MAVKIRWQRQGRRNRPFFRLVACEARTPRDGKTLEILGHYDPLAQDTSRRVVVRTERVRHWFAQGAVPTESVVTLLRRLGIQLHRERKKKSRPGPASGAPPAEA